MASLSRSLWSVNTDASLESVEATTLRDLVRASRIERGMTQTELAEAVGMSQRWLSNLETGNIDMPRPDTMRRLSDALALPLADLYVAAGRAKTKAEAERIAELQGAASADDLRLLERISRLTPNDRRTVESIVDRLLTVRAFEAASPPAEEPEPAKSPAPAV